MMMLSMINAVLFISAAGVQFDKDTLHKETPEPTPSPTAAPACLAPNVTNSSGDGACFEGDIIQHNETCTPVCAEGHTAMTDDGSVWDTDCSDADATDCYRCLCDGDNCKYTTDAFQCEATTCTLPSGNNEGGCGGGHEAGGTIASGLVCMPKCADGYKLATVDYLSCFQGALNMTVSCVAEATCSVSSAHHDASATDEDDTVYCTASTDSAQSCTPACNEGYTAWYDCSNADADGGTECDDGSKVDDVMYCTDGSWTAENYKGASTNFSCVESACNMEDEDIPTWGSSSDCVAGVDSGTNCTPSCLYNEEEDRATPSDAVLKCTRGSYSPATFSCSASDCAVPTVEHSSQACSESNVTISSGSSCTPQCDDGRQVQCGDACADGKIPCSYGVMAVFTCHDTIR